MSVEHYENFPVASWLCPRHLRPPIAAIYWFARTADDLADCDQAAWRTLRATLDDRQQSRAAQSRFRRDPAAYLNGLENRLSKLTLPT